MYINIKKISKIFGVILAVAVLGFGVFSYVIALSAQQQIVGVLTAIFGLQFGWFILWATKEK